VRLDDESKILEDLYALIMQNRGNRPLKITITAKLQNVVIDSDIRVANSIVATLEGNEYIDILG